MTAPAPEDAERERLSARWRERWPRHCRACGGWGLLWPGLPADPDRVELCTAMGPTQCHRCGGLGRPSGAEPCQYCGWEFDDGC